MQMDKASLTHSHGVSNRVVDPAFEKAQIRIRFCWMKIRFFRELSLKRIWSISTRIRNSDE